MNASDQSDTPCTTAPIALWRIAEAFMHTLFGLFGAPADLAESQVLTTKLYRLTCAWLSVGEAILRRLLLIEAAALPAGATPARTQPSKPRTRTLVEFHADKSDDWRVSFRCFSGERASAAFDKLRQAPFEASARVKSSACLSLSKTARSPRRFHSSWPLALRFEALLRVFNDPLPFARRLARRLRTDPQRLPAILRAPPDAAHKTGDEEFAALTQAAETAWKPPNPGSPAPNPVPFPD